MEVLDKINVLAVVVLAVVVVVVGSTMSHRENINRNQINLVFGQQIKKYCFLI